MCRSCVCRVCSQKKDILMPLSTNIKSISLAEKINICTMINVQIGDSYPQNICINCFKNLNITYNFVELCQKSDKHLRDFDNNDEINSSKEIDLIDQISNSEIKIKKIDCTQNWNDFVNDTKCQSVSEISKTTKIFKRLLKFKDVTLKSINRNLHFTKFDPQPKIIINYDRNFLVEEFPFKNLVNDVASNKKCHNSEEKIVKIENNIETDFNYSYDLPYDDVECEDLKDESDSNIPIIGQGFIINYDRKYLENTIITNKKVKKRSKKIFKQKVVKNYEELMCPVCGKMLRSNMKRHVEVFHKGNRPFTCKICQRTFKDKAYLLDHENQHTGNKKYLCTLCGMAFVQASGYRQHLRSHPEISSNKCTLCPKVFRTPGLLGDHMNIHTGDRKYSCKICQERFHTKATLRRHSIIHKERKHKCDMCKKTFHGQHDLSRHMLVHTGIKSFQCDVCAAKFTQKHDMKKHIMRHFRSSSIYNSRTSNNRSYT